MITPFVGLSILTHIVIIIYYGIVEFIQNNRETISRIFNKYFGFIGLFISTYLAGIIFYLISRITQGDYEVFNKVFKKYIGFIIIIFIFGFIFTSAVSLVILSITESHSTIVFIKNSNLLPTLVDNFYYITFKINEVS